MIRSLPLLRMTAASALFLFLGVFLPPAAYPASAAASLPFQDISGSYAKDAIVRLYHLNLIDGTGNGRFEPYRQVTRAEYTAMIDRLFRLEQVDGAIPAFSDVAPDSWAYRWIEPAVQLGIVTGVGPGVFEPARAVKRQDAAVMMVRAAKQSASAAAAAAKPPVYRDQGRIAGYALPSVLRLTELGLMQGDGKTFRPDEPITRQEAAVLLDRIVRQSGWMAQIQAATPPKIQLGWQYGLSTAQYESKILQSNVNTLSPRWFFLEDSGIELASGYDASLLAWAHQRGYKVWAMVGNHSDQQRTHDQLSDAARRAALVAALTDEVKNKKIDGLNVDFENVAPADRKAFTSFISELASALDGIPAALSVNLSPDMGTDWTAAYDYAALGRSADYIVLMGYDEHWGNDPEPGSVASLPWVENGLSKLLKQVPAHKTILAMPLYTRDWTLYAGAAVASQDWTLVQQNDAVSSRSIPTVWNPVLGQYTADYWVEGKRHALWLEDGRSLSAKMLVAETSAIAGYAYWYIGGESPDVWASLRNALRYANYRF